MSGFFLHYSGLNQDGQHFDVQIGSKLEYVFGKATGNAHNIEWSKCMLR